MRLITILFFLLISSEIFSQVVPPIVKGSDLETATTPTGSEYLIGLQGGHTKKFPWSFVTGGGGTITSVFGRSTSAIVAQSSDYASFYYPLGSNPAHYLTTVTQGMVRRLFTVNSPLLYDSSTATFSLQYASGSQPGGITAANFSTFNNKENALTFYTGLSRSGNVIRGKIVGTDTGMVTPAQKVIWDNKQDAFNFSQNKIAGRFSSGAGSLEQISLSSQFSLISGVLTFIGRAGDSVTFNGRYGPTLMPMAGDYTYNMVGAYPLVGNPSNFELQSNKATTMAVINDVKYVTTGLLKRQIDSLRAAGVIFTCTPPLRFGSGGSGLVALIDNTGHPIVDPLGNQLYAYEAGTNLQIDSVTPYSSGAMTPYDYYLLMNPPAEVDPYYTTFGARKATTVSVNGSTPQSLASNVNITIPIGGRVDSVSSGNLTGLFNSSVSSPTSKPSISYSLNIQGANKVYASPDAFSGTPGFRSLSSNDLPVIDFGTKVGGKPNTAAGYGITDVYTQTQINNFFSASAGIAGYNKTAWDAIAAKTKLGQFINDVGFVTLESDPLSPHLASSYADPSWIISLSKSKILGLIDPVNPDWNSSSGLSMILHKPSIPTKTRVYPGVNTSISGTPDSVVVNSFIDTSTVSHLGTLRSISFVGFPGFNVAPLTPITTNGTVTFSTSLNGLMRASAGAFTTGQASLTSEVTGILPIANGGTNASTALSARFNLGLAIGSNVEAWDVDLDGLAGVSTTGFVKRTGTGTFSAAPLSISDIPDLSSIYALTGIASNPFSDATNLVKNSVDATKLLRLSAASISTGTTRTLTAQNANYTIAGTNISNTFSADQSFGDRVLIKSATHPENYIMMDDVGDFITINSPEYINLNSSNGPYFSQHFINYAATGYDVTYNDGISYYGTSFNSTTSSIVFEALNNISGTDFKKLTIDTIGFHFNDGNVIPPSGTWNYQLPEKSGTFAMLSDITGLGSGTLSSVDLSGSEFTFSNHPLTSNGAIGIALATNGVAYSKLSQATGFKLLGNASSSTGNIAAVGIDNTLAFSSGNLGVKGTFLATPGTAGTAPNWSNGIVFPNQTQTLNIPMASATGVTAGLISNFDYGLFYNAASNVITTLTTIGSSGPATLASGVLNIPNYAGVTTYTPGSFSSTGVSQGLDITGSVISMHAADASHPGGLLVGDQTLPIGIKSLAQNGSDPTTTSGGNTSYELKFPSSSFSSMFGVVRNDWTLRSGTGSTYGFNTVLDFRQNGNSVMQLQNGNILSLSDGASGTTVKSETYIGDRVQGKGNGLFLSGNGSNGRDLFIPDESTSSSNTSGVQVQGSQFDQPTISVYTSSSNATLNIQGKGTGSVVFGSRIDLVQYTSSTRPSSPATGSVIYCTNCTATDASTGVMQIYNGTTWKNAW